MDEARFGQDKKERAHGQSQTDKQGPSLKNEHFVGRETDATLHDERQDHDYGEKITTKKRLRGNQVIT